MTRVVAALAACGGLAASPAAALAQRADALAVGARVRVNGHCPRSEFGVTTATGTLAQPLSPELRPDRDTVVLARGAATRAIPASEVLSLDLSAERNNRLANGARMGLVVGGIGVLTGALAGAAIPPGDGDYQFTRGQQAALLAAVVGIPSFVIGLVVGTAADPEQWTPVTMRCSIR